MFNFFGRKRSKADAALAIMDDAIELACQRWKVFNQNLVFKEEVGLKDKITTFAFPMFDGLRNTFPELKDSPDALLLILVAKGVEKSQTHTEQEIEAALGVVLPQN